MAGRTSIWEMVQRNHREAQKSVVTAVAKDEKWSNKFVKLKDGCLRQEDKWYDLTEGDTEFLRRKATTRLAEFGECEE